MTGQPLLGEGNAEMRDTFTRAELLAALCLEPCHVTGMHDPNHTDGSVCDIQRAKAFDRLLAVLGVSEGELPRALHDDCYWCRGIPTQEKYREQKRGLHRWAGVPVPDELAAPAPDHGMFDVSEREVMRAMRRAPKVKDGWVTIDALRETLGLPRHTPKIMRPAHRLVEKGKLAFRNDYEAGHSAQFRVA